MNNPGYRVDQLNRPPKTLRRIDPDIPIVPGIPSASARVVIQIIINEQGAVWSGEVTGGPEELRKPALEAVRQWRYEPMRVDGQPVPVIMVVSVSFARASFDPAQRTRRSNAEPPGREPIRVGANVQAQKLIHKVEPPYPEGARAARISDVVVIQVTVNERGEVYKARMLRGHPLLENAALDAILQWRYSPTFLGGEPVPVIAVVSVSFSPRSP